MKKQKVQWQKLKWNFSFYDLWFVLSKSFNGIMFRLLGESLIAKVCLGNFDIAFVFTRLLEEQWHIVLIWSIAAPKKQSLTLASDSNHVKYVHTRLNFYIDFSFQFWLQANTLPFRNGATFPSKREPLFQFAVRVNKMQ